MATKQLNNTRFDTRLPKEQKLFFEKAATIGGYRSLTDFVVLAAQEKAKQILKEKETIIASQRDSDLFFTAILNPSKPNKNLLAAAKYYKKQVSK